MYCVATFSTSGDVTVYTVTSPIYTDRAYLVKYLPISIYDSGKQPYPIPAEIKRIDTETLRPLQAVKSYRDYISFCLIKAADKKEKDAGCRNASAVEVIKSRSGCINIVRELERNVNTRLAVRIYSGAATRSYSGSISIVNTFSAGRRMRLSVVLNENIPLNLESHVFNILKRLSQFTRNTVDNTKTLFISSSKRADLTVYKQTETFIGSSTGGRGIELDSHLRFTSAFSRASSGITQDKMNAIHKRGILSKVEKSSRYTTGSAAIVRNVDTYMTVFNGVFNNQFILNRRTNNGIVYFGISNTTRRPGYADTGSRLHQFTRITRKTRFVKDNIGLINAGFDSFIGSDSYWIGQVGVKAEKVQEINRSGRGVLNTSILCSMQYDRIKSQPANGNIVEEFRVNSKEIDNSPDKLVKWHIKPRKKAKWFSGVELSYRDYKQLYTLNDVKRYESNSAEAHFIKQDDGQRTKYEITKLCIPRGLFWDELWEQLYKEYGNKTDRLQLPPVDFEYDISRLYDRNTGEPFVPLSRTDLPEVMVAFPPAHPVGKYSDVGLKIVNVHLWVLRDILLLLYRDRKEYGLQYEKLPPGEAIRTAIDRLYNKLRQFDYKKEEYERAFRMARWYGEYVIVSTNNYWLIRDYETWISHESSYNLIDGLPVEDIKYIKRRDGWASDPANSMYTTVRNNAVLELRISNLLPTSFEFTINIVNKSGGAKVNFTIDGRDKNYLISSFARAEADLPAGEHIIRFEFESESDEDRVELSGMKVDYVKFKSAQVIESPKDINGAEALDMLIDMLKRYYELHHEGKNKGTRLINLGHRIRFGR